MMIFYKELTLHKGGTLSPNIFEVYINDMIAAVEAAKLGFTMGEDTVSGLTFADGFVGISENTRSIAETDSKSTSRVPDTLLLGNEWRVSANMKKCTVSL